MAASSTPSSVSRRVLGGLGGAISLCVAHSSGGTYDFHESDGMAFGKSETNVEIIDEDWKEIRS